MENVVRTRMFVTDIGNAEKVMAEHSKVFNTIRPAATLVMVSRRSQLLANKEKLFLDSDSVSVTVLVYCIFCCQFLWE